MKRITSIAFCAALLTACASYGKDAATASSSRMALAAVPMAELPAKAADLVLRAKPADRKATTLDVVKSALGINPTAATSIVGAIAHAVPDMAAVAAAAAAVEQPRQASAIAKAAAAAAPAQASAIVAAVCRVAPAYYPNVAVAVSQVAPEANREIVQAVGAAQPTLQPALEKVLAGYQGKIASVGGVLAEAGMAAQNPGQTGPAAVTPPSAPSPVAPSAPSTPIASVTPVVTPEVPAAPTPLPELPVPPARGPAVGPPYFPLITTPTNVPPSGSTELPTGGRNYAKP